MGRRLPWKRAGDAVTSSPQRTPETESPAPPTPTPTPARESHCTPTLRRQRAPESRLGSVRSPSTSPPPEPPQERLMLAGPFADDRYRMVEDEFLHTAQRFTTHLHRAEYNRLKARAESQNAAAIRAIARPVVGLLTASARVRHEAARRAAKQRTVLQAADGGGGDPEPWIGTSLQGLMERPRNETRSITSYTPAHSTTRAAAGYHPTSTTDRPSNKRDNLPSHRRHCLDITSPAPSTPAPLRVTASSQPSTTPRHPAQHSTPSRSRDPVTLTTSRTATATAGTHTPSRSGSVRDKAGDGRMRGGRQARADLAHAHASEDDNDDPFGFSRRKARREQSKEKLRKPGEKDPPKKLSPDTIPSFL
ncbi:hypothetical protein TOPH_02214 [Tolypocladium ophioglossoides CBS 100239]|uniref:Uncharacterized protein n=1 Tax=Tolypocladium ophioglossoides (strain CBS 100239) TaxID=1163406 RepID=A0A0L0NGE3_TOLOC|nr:hypothetical protein TOPH_02214 [Tolypocladium ophioglossoides CBS 100239]